MTEGACGLARMFPHVSPETTNSGELLTAERACCLARVLLHVFRKVTAVTVCSTAYGTDARTVTAAGDAADADAADADAAADSTCGQSKVER